jgi:hypothetical protein
MPFPGPSIGRRGPNELGGRFSVVCGPGLSAKASLAGFSGPSRTRPVTSSETSSACLARGDFASDCDYFAELASIWIHASTSAMSVTERGAGRRQ